MKKLMMKKSRALIIVPLAASVSVFFLLILGFSMFVKISNFRSDEAEEEKELNRYRFLQLDTSRNSSSVGILSFSETLDEGGYILKEHDSKITLISDFSTDEYVCSGSCSCEGELNKDRRSATRVVSNGLVVLVAALSAGIALKQAGEEFQNECEEDFSSYCESESVISSVEKCERVIIRKRKEQETRIFDDAKGREIVDRGREYECSGHCLPNTKISTDAGRKYAREYGCHKLTKSGKITVGELTLNKCLTQEREKAILEKAFISKHLGTFCHSQSIGAYWFFVKDRETFETKRLGKGLKKTVRACVGSTYDHYLRFDRNRSIRCVPIGAYDSPIEEFSKAWEKV